MASLPTKNTELFFVDPADNSVTKVGCPTSITGISAAREQIETTCLDSNGRTYVPGLATPGAASFTLNFDPSDTSHVRLHELYAAGTSLNWVIGFSDGATLPTADTAGDVVVPTNRSFIVFDGYVNDFPFEIAINTVVVSTLGIQISGVPVLSAKV